MAILTWTFIVHPTLSPYEQLDSWLLVGGLWGENWIPVMSVTQFILTKIFDICFIVAASPGRCWKTIRTSWGKIVSFSGIKSELPFIRSVTVSIKDHEIHTSVRCRSSTTIFRYKASLSWAKGCLPEFSTHFRLHTMYIVAYSISLHVSHLASVFPNRKAMEIQIHSIRDPLYNQERNDYKFF